MGTEREVKFARLLEQAKEEARAGGNCISEERIKEIFAELDFNEEQLKMVYDYLKQRKIGIGEPLDEDQYLTGTERDYLQIYLEQLKGLKSVSDGEKEAITLSAMAGDPAARQMLTEIYLPDVVEIARLYAGQGVLIEDLIGEGNVALASGVMLLGCAENAQEAGGMLARMIMNAMEEHISETADGARTDKRALEKVNTVMEKAKELSEDLRRKVTPAELSGETGLSVEEIEDAVRISGYRIEYIEVQRDV